VSGVRLGEGVLEAYNAMKGKSKNKFVIFKISERAGEVGLDYAGTKDDSYDDFLEGLPDGECRFGVYDYEYENADGCIFNKFVFVSWSPDCAQVKQKMLYASTGAFLKEQLDGIALELQASDHSEVEEAEMRERLKQVLTRK